MFPHKILSLLSLAVSAPALAIPVSADFAQKVRDVVLPDIQRSCRESTFEGRADVTIHYRHCQRRGNGPTVVLVPGRGESSTHYFELIHDLLGYGYDVYAIDNRGHGHSGSFVPEAPTRTSVDRFAYYVDDLETLMKTYVLPARHGRVYVLGHSMGGVIASLYAIRSPGAIDGLVLSDPMMQINTGEYSEMKAWFLSGLKIDIGQGGELGPGQDYDPNGEFVPNGSGTNSRERSEMVRELLIEDPTSIRGGSTFKWIHESIGGGRKARAQASKLRTPTLLIGSENRDIVVPAGQEEFCSKAPDCKLVRIPGSKHNLWKDVDPVRNQFLSLARGWMK